MNNIKVHIIAEDQDQEWKFNLGVKCSSCKEMGSWVDKEEHTNPLGLCKKCIKKEQRRGILVCKDKIPKPIS